MPHFAGRFFYLDLSLRIQCIWSPIFLLFTQVNQIKTIEYWIDKVCTTGLEYFGNQKSWDTAFIWWWVMKLMCQNLSSRRIHSAIDWYNHLGSCIEWWVVFLPKWLCCCSADLAHLLPDPAHSKGCISALKLHGYGYKLGSIVKQKE